MRGGYILAVSFQSEAVPDRYRSGVSQRERKVGESSIRGLIGTFRERFEVIAMTTCTCSRPCKISNRLSVDKLLKVDPDRARCVEAKTVEKWEILLDSEGALAGEGRKPNSSSILARPSWPRGGVRFEVGRMDEAWTTEMQISKTMNIGSLCLLLVASALSVGAMSASGRSDVVLVEPIVHPGGVVSGYALVKLSGKEDTPRTLATSKDPLEPLACNAARVIYLDQEGKIWRVPVGGGDAVLLATTQFVPKEDLVGKTVLDLENRALFAVINSQPEKTARWAGHEFSVVKYSFDGQQTRIGNGDGKAMVLWQVSADVLEVVSSKGVLDFDPRGKRAISKTIGAPEDAAKAALVTSSLAVFADFSAIQVKKGLAGPLVAEFKGIGGFRIVSDIDPDARKVLSIFLNDDMNGARIDELDVSTGEVRERYASAGIGTARFCEK